MILSYLYAGFQLQSLQETTKNALKFLEDMGITKNFSSAGSKKCFASFQKDKSTVFYR